MLPKEPIETTLKDLQRLYDHHSDSNHKIYFSKLALLELCGWIELAQDEIIKSYSSTKLTKQSNKDEIEKLVLKTYGFSYKNHFRQMIIQLIGFTKTEILEDNLTGDILILKTQLGALSGLRNPSAHTPISGTISTYQSPSTMLIGSRDTWETQALQP